MSGHHTGAAGPARGAGVPRRVLEEIRAAAPGTGLDTIAHRLGLSRDDVDAAVGYWLHRGELALEQLECAPVNCTGCALRSSGCAPGGRAGGPVTDAGNRTSVSILSAS